jgi:hypothetical protein
MKRLQTLADNPGLGERLVSVGAAEENVMEQKK